MKKLLSLLLALSLCFGFACAQEVDDVEVWLEYPYGSVVNFVKAYLEGGEPVPAVPDSIQMFLMDYGKEAAEDVGFTLLDINADLDPELIFARISDRTDGVCTGSSVIAVFSLQGMSPFLMLEGFARVRYAIMSDARIYNEGSASAFGGGCAVYSFSGEYHDTELTLVEGYDYEYNEQGIASYTHSTLDANGEHVATPLAISDSEYRERVAALSEGVLTLTLTPVLDYVHEK